jgi:DNA-binding protein HU-beta
MTKPELIRELAEDFEIPRRQVAELIEAILEKMTATLKSGEVVALTPFGRFRIRDRAARMGRNPATGEAIKIPAKRVLRFTPGKTLKEAVSSKRAGAGGAKKKSTAKKSAAGPTRKAPARKKAATGRKASR